MINFFFHIYHPKSGWSVKLNDVKESAWWEATHSFSNFVFLQVFLFSKKKAKKNEKKSEKMDKKKQRKQIRVHISSYSLSDVSCVSSQFDSLLL